MSGIIVCYWYSKKKKIQIWNLLDYLVPSLAIAQAIGRWGNFVNVEAYGTQTNLPWKMGILQEESWQYVHPTFLYESIATFFIFVYLSKKSKKRNFQGEITFLYLILYSFLRFWIESLRIDSLMFFSVRISQVISFGLFICFCLIFIKQVEKQKMHPKNIE